MKETDLIVPLHDKLVFRVTDVAGDRQQRKKCVFYNVATMFIRCMFGMSVVLVFDKIRTYNI